MLRGSMTASVFLRSLGFSRSAFAPKARAARLSTAARASEEMVRSPSIPTAATCLARDCTAMGWSKKCACNCGATPARVNWRGAPRSASLPSAADHKRRACSSPALDRVTLSQGCAPQRPRQIPRRGRGPGARLRPAGDPLRAADVRRVRRYWRCLLPRSDDLSRAGRQIR